jgi:hypothetical protein
MRTIEDHKVNPANDRVDITVTDEPGAGGANHVYRITYGLGPSGNVLLLKFQNGPIA